MRHQHGFTYVGAMIMVAVFGAALASAVTAGSALTRRGAEDELLAIGQEFRAALKSYAESTPVGQPDAPRELDELLRDRRQPSVLRHLRRLYPDPLTGKVEWGVVRGPDGRIAGVHSLAQSEAIRLANFPAGLEALEGKRRHDQWVFAWQPAVQTPKLTQTAAHR
jgi:type II secretory pathway pseudopilin PulG